MRRFFAASFFCGYQGGVLLLLRAYLSLWLNLMEEVEATAITLWDQRWGLSVAKAIMEFGGKEFTCKAYPALGVRRPLSG